MSRLYLTCDIDIGGFTGIGVDSQGLLAILCVISHFAEALLYVCKARKKPLHVVNELLQRTLPGEARCLLRHGKCRLHVEFVRRLEARRAGPAGVPAGLAGHRQAGHTIDVVHVEILHRDGGGAGRGSVREVHRAGDGAGLGALHLLHQPAPVAW